MRLLSVTGTWVDSENQNRRKNNYPKPGLRVPRTLHDVGRNTTAFAFDVAFADAPAPIRLGSFPSLAYRPSNVE